MTAYLGIVWLGDLSHVTDVREGGAGALQRAVDGRDRGPQLRGDLGGTELQYLAEQEHGSLTCWQDLHRRHQREPHVGPRFQVDPRVRKWL